MYVQGGRQGGRGEDTFWHHRVSTPPALKIDLDELHQKKHQGRWIDPPTSARNRSIDPERPAHIAHHGHRHRRSSRRHPACTVRPSKPQSARLPLGDRWGPATTPGPAPRRRRSVFAACACARCRSIRPEPRADPVARLGRTGPWIGCWDRQLPPRLLQLTHSPLQANCRRLLCIALPSHAANRHAYTHTQEGLKKPATPQQ